MELLDRQDYNSPLCEDMYCYAELDGVFIYGDRSHLSEAGSIYLGKEMNFYSLITSK